jgi:hypothetical protein
MEFTSKIGKAGKPGVANPWFAKMARKNFANGPQGLCKRPARTLQMACEGFANGPQGLCQNSPQGLCKWPVKAFRLLRTEKLSYISAFN